MVDAFKMFNEAAATDPVLNPRTTGPQPSFTARENYVTEQTTGPAPVQGQAPGWVRSALGVIHRDMHTIGGAIDHAWPLIKLLAGNERLDAMVETWLVAENLGVAAEAFEAATDSLRGAVKRKQAQQAADAAQASLTGTGGMQALGTGPQPVQGLLGQPTEAMHLGPDGQPLQ